MRSSRTHIVLYSPCEATEESIVPRDFVVVRESAMIRKVRGGYQVISSKGRNLGGPYKTVALAKKRLRQIEFFKHHKG
jgi:hypothetical protein